MVSATLPKAAEACVGVVDFMENECEMIGY